MIKIFILKPLYYSTENIGNDANHDTIQEILSQTLIKDILHYPNELLHGKLLIPKDLKLIIYMVRVRYRENKIYTRT